MIIYLYRWKLKPGKETQFKMNWELVTTILRRECGSLGSRLHVSMSGDWVGYAQWPDLATRDACGFSSPELDSARQAMRDAVAQSFPEEVLEVSADLLGAHAPSARH